MNRNFAQLDENNKIVYAPDWVIRVDHHHEEWDEPVYDEDGNPIIDPDTGEQKTEHKTSDWDTERRELHPTADDYAHAKDGPWLPLDSTKPEKDGAYFVSTEYGDLVDGRIVRRYDERPIVAPEPINRRWTRLKIKTALAMAGMIVKAEEYLSGVDIAPNYNAWQALSDCDYVEENWPQKETWNAVLDGAAEAFGKTRAEIDAFIDSIPTEEMR